MRPAIIFIAFLSSLAPNAHAQAPAIVATAIKMTVTSKDGEAVNAVAREWVAQGHPVNIGVAVTETTSASGAAVQSAPTGSVTMTLKGAFTVAQVADAQARCQRYATRPGMTCSAEATRN